MIVCDRCGKLVKYKSSLITKYKISTLDQLEPGKLYPVQLNHYSKNETHYDLCQECLYDVLKNLSEFVKQGKFNGELK